MDKSKLRIIFLGTPDFAVESLKCICEANYNVVAVITAPDRKSGRGQKVNQSAVKQYAVDQGLEVLQPTNLKDPEFLNQLKQLKADLQIVVAFRMLPEAVWNMPPLGTFNLHASLLPKYRGAAPINWAIINQEKVTGITTFFLKHEIDTGDIILQKEVAIEENETAGSLHDKLMNEGGQLVLASLELILTDQVELKGQDAALTQIPHAPKIFREDCKIDWNKNAEEIHAFIRGLSPYPAAWTRLKQKEQDKSLSFKVYLSEIALSNSLRTGELKDIDGQITVGTKSTDLILTNVQLEGKKRMMAKDLLNGINLEEYEIQF